MNDMAQSRFADCENKLLEVDSIARTTGSVEMKLSHCPPIVPVL